MVNTEEIFNISPRKCLISQQRSLLGGLGFTMQDIRHYSQFCFIDILFANWNKNIWSTLQKVVISLVIIVYMSKMAHRGC